LRISVDSGGEHVFPRHARRPIFSKQPLFYETNGL